MLTLLSGSPHRVWTGVCLWATFRKDPDVRVDVTTLIMDRLSDEQLQKYLDSGMWQGKAGAFGFQDRLGWIHISQGSQSNVLGLPMELLAEMLTESESDTF